MSEISQLACVNLLWLPISIIYSNAYSEQGWGGVLSILKVIYHPLYSMNNFVINKSKLPQDGVQVFPYMGWLAIMWPSERVAR